MGEYQYKRGVGPVSVRMWHNPEVHSWKVGDEVWARYYDLPTDSYVAKLLGQVVGVGPKGFSVKLARPPLKGERTQRLEHDAGVWATREEAEAHIALRPGPGIR